jgi:DNA polymerase ligase (LigD)-like protein
MKFVVHFHETTPRHYDFMIESGDHLETWQIEYDDLNLLLQGNKIKCKKIVNHRKKYLTYEGPISCDRGRVEILDSGNYSIINEELNKVSLNLNGCKFKGNLYIIKIRDDIYDINFKK